jgi:Peptidase M15
MLRFQATVKRPPTSVVLRVNRFSPGFWPAFATRLDALRELDLTVTSWWRNAVQNREVGGASGSQHLVGTALDFIGPERAMEAGAIAANSVGLVGMVHAVAGGARHLHVQAWPGGLVARVGLV